MIDPIERRILLVALSSWVNRHQHEVSDYVGQENHVLKEHLGGCPGLSDGALPTRGTRHVGWQIQVRDERLYLNTLEVGEWRHLLHALEKGGRHAPARRH